MEKYGELNTHTAYDFIIKENAGTVIDMLMSSKVWPESYPNVFRMQRDEFVDFCIERIESVIGEIDKPETYHPTEVDFYVRIALEDQIAEEEEIKTFFFSKLEPGDIYVIRDDDTLNSYKKINDCTRVSCSLKEKDKVMPESMYRQEFPDTKTKKIGKGIIKI